MNIQELSNCSEDDWATYSHKVVAKNFIPIEDRVKIFKEVYGLIIQMNLRVWITGGTLLGAIRDKTFIESDDDIDMDMLEPDFINVMYVLRGRLIDLGYIVRLTDGNNPKMSFFKSGFKTSIGALKIQGKWLTRPLRKYPLEIFEIDRFIEFYGVRCLIPNPPEDYLEHVYGKQWITPIHSDNDDWCDYISIRAFNFTCLTSYFLTIKVVIKRIINKL
jgi:lipopolysaccharide cholinephosphotransferase